VSVCGSSTNLFFIFADSVSQSQLHINSSVMFPLSTAIVGSFPCSIGKELRVSFSSLDLCVASFASESLLESNISC